MLLRFFLDIWNGSRSHWTNIARAWLCNKSTCKHYELGFLLSSPQRFIWVQHWRFLGRQVRISFYCILSLMKPLFRLNSTNSSARNQKFTELLNCDLKIPAYTIALEGYCEFKQHYKQSSSYQLLEQEAQTLLLTPLKYFKSSRSSTIERNSC